MRLERRAYHGSHMKVRRDLLAASLTAALTLAAAGQTPSFQGLGQMPGSIFAGGTYSSGISGDGSTIMGYGWVCAGGQNFANIFDQKAKAFLQIAGANRIVIDTGLNLPSMLWASQWDESRSVLAYRHLDTVLEVGLVRPDGSACHAAALDPESREVTGLFSLQGWNNDSVWARGQAPVI